MSEKSDKMSGREARALRGQGHHLRPAVFIGKEGLTEAVVASLDGALGDSELVKVKLLETTGIDRKRFAHELADIVSAQVAQVLGKTVLLYRPKKLPDQRSDED